MIITFLIRRLRRRRAARHTSRPATRPAPGGRGALALVAHQARYDLTGLLRNRQARFFTIVLPVLFLVIFVSVFGNHTVGPDHVKSSTYYVPGLSAMAVIASSFVNLVITITAQRESGVLKRRRATPVPAGVVIAGRTVTALLTSLVVMAVMLVIGRFAYGVTLPGSTIPGVVLTAAVGSITFCVLGYAVSTVISSADSAQPMVQAMILPLYFISGVFIPNVNLPGWLQDVARFFPVEHLADGLHHAYDPAVHGSGIVWGDIGSMAIWAAVGLAVALRRFSWSPAAAGA